VTISPDGKYIAYTHARDDKSSIWLRQLATNTNIEIVPAAGIIYGLSFTNSGDSLYFVSGPSMNLSRISVLGGVTTKIVEQIEGNFSLSSDDSQIAFDRKPIGADGEPEYALTIARSNGSSERILLTQKYPVRLDSPLWSPGDQSIICSMGGSQSGSQDVRIVDVRIADGLTNELSSERFFHISKLAW